MSRSNGAKQIGNKQWPHTPEALLRGRLVYNVKFYGDQEVDQPKGVEPIKEAVRKMKFNKQLRKSEGQKTTPKVELQISVDGISLQEPKSKVQQYKFPLHHISYCADDKTEKKLFTFIAKDGATGKHHCFVLGSEKNAEEITLTIGQAFDLAYKRFIEKQGNKMKEHQQFILLQRQVTKLQEENKSLKARIAELEGVQQYSDAIQRSASVDQSSHLDSSRASLPGGTASVDSTLFDNDFNPIHSTNGNAATPSPAKVKLAPPPQRTSQPLPVAAPSSGQQSVVAAPAQSTGTTASSIDAFGMTSFNPSELMELDDIRSAFSRGLSMGEDFDLTDLDPLNSK